MRSEKKHLVTSEVGDYDLTNASVSSTQMLAVRNNPETASLISGSGLVNDYTRSMSASGNAVGMGAAGGGSSSGWYNTIPHSTSTLSKRSNRSKRLQYQKDSYDKDYMKKRNLILELLAVELEFLITWYNPNCLPDLIVPGEPRKKSRLMICYKSYYVFNILLIFHGSSYIPSSNRLLNSLFRRGTDH